MNSFAELHDRAVRVLARLNRLQIDRQPAGLRDRLLAQRADLEALIAATTPETVPLLDAAFARLGRMATVDELWTMVRAPADHAGPDAA